MDNSLVTIDRLNKLLNQAQTAGFDLLLKIIMVAIIFFVGRWVARLLQKFIRRALSRTNIDSTLVLFSSNLAFYGAMTFVLLAILGELGIETTSLLTLLGTAGIAVGLALQGSLANFAAGILLIIFRPFRVGDWIECNGVSGYVEDLELLTTKLRTVDNRVVVIPNNKLTEDNLINYSAKGILRLNLVVGVAYDSDLQKVKQIIHEVLLADERVARHPEPGVGVLELADSSINFAVRPWVKPDDYWALSLSLYEDLKIRFDQEGIEIPFPHRELHVRSIPERSVTSMASLSGAL